MDDKSNAKFSVRTVAEQYYMEVNLSGFFSEPDMVKFLQALDVERRKLGSNCSGKRRSLYDLSEFRLQTQNIVDMFFKLASDPTRRPDRLAIYVGDAAVKMQASRRLPPNAQLFDNVADARKWLWQEIGT
jgi:hypothetical protein